MAAGSPSESQAAKRSWVVLLYFYLAALAGLGFVITGTTMVLFGAKNALFPGLGLPSYSYEYEFPGDPGRPGVPTDEQREAARQRAIDERRGSGLDGMLDGVIVTAVGTPVLVWHLKRGRALGAAVSDGPPATDSEGRTAPPSPPQ